MLLFEYLTRVCLVLYASQDFKPLDLNKKEMLHSLCELIPFREHMHESVQENIIKAR